MTFSIAWSINLLATTAIVALLLAYELYNDTKYLVISTSSGRVRGFSASKSRLGKEFYQFLGNSWKCKKNTKTKIAINRYSICSATVEIFCKSPRPVAPWEGVKDALNYGSKCMQVDGLSRIAVGSEDCLFLNIFVPKIEDVDLGKRNLLPVIFYIHGGYFMVGTASLMGPEYLMDDSQIILVTLNYRLNAFGFLNIDVKNANANAGLKDQHLALKWISENVEKFGGDPSKIIMTGQSAGAAAVHFHVLSPMSKGLFSGAIMASGTAIKPWSLVSDPYAQAEHLGKLLKCPIKPSADLLSCLRNISAEAIVNALIHSLDTPIMNPLEIFAPSVENCVQRTSQEDCFLPSHPFDLMHSGNIANVPILTGITSEEGLLATGRMYFNATLIENVEQHWDELSPNFFVYPKDRSDLTLRLRKFYLGSAQSRPAFHEQFQNITNAFSDRLYIHATREFAKTQSKHSHSPVYLYYFSYLLNRGMEYIYDINPNYPVLSQFAWKEIQYYFNEYILRRKSLKFGVGHGDDISLVFKLPLFGVSPSSEDFEISRQMVKLWVNFATNPTNLVFSNETWEPISPKDSKLKYMHICNCEEHGKLVEEPFVQRMEFWDKILEDISWKS